MASTALTCKWIRKTSREVKGRREGAKQQSSRLVNGVKICPGAALPSPFSLTVLLYRFWGRGVACNSPLPLSPLLRLYLCQRMPQTKQRQDHTKHWQSVEDQAPYGERINSKACGTHSRRAPSHLHVPLICIFTKRPLWLSLISKPLPTASSAHAGLTRGKRAGGQRVPSGTTRAHARTQPADTQIRTKSIFAHAVHKCAMAE